MPYLDPTLICCMLARNSASSTLWISSRFGNQTEDGLCKPVHLCKNHHLCKLDGLCKPAPLWLAAQLLPMLQASTQMSCFAMIVQAVASCASILTMQADGQSMQGCIQRCSSPCQFLCASHSDMMHFESHPVQCSGVIQLSLVEGFTAACRVQGGQFIGMGPLQLYNQH